MMNLTFPEFDGDELRLVGECLDSRWVTQGPFTKKFEGLFAARHQVKHALATTSCTAALHLATLALDLKPGDEVIVPALTWVTSAHAAEYVGAKAVFAEIEADTFNLDPKAFAAAITPRTRAVMVVHLFGLAAKMDELLDIARKHNVAVIEDAACAVGTTYDGRPIGSFGDLGCFSFHPRKVVTTGEGGMVTTEDDGLAKRVASLRNHGSTGPGPLQDPTRPYHMGTFNMLGFNLRLSDIQAAVGVAQMAKLDRLLAERLKLANRYHELLANVDDIARPAVPKKCGHTYQSFVLRVLKGGRERRNAVMNHMQKAGIQTRPGTHAVHRLGYYAEKYGLKPGDFPIAATSEDTTITLPIFPGMTEGDLKTVCDALKAGLTA
jgi:perosamine synthetase